MHQEGRTLLLSGRVGSIKLDLSVMDPTGLVAMKLHSRPRPGGGGNDTLLLCASPSKRYFKGIATHIDNHIHGVMQVRGGGVAQRCCWACVPLSSCCHNNA